MRRIWQRAMIGLARAERVKGWVQTNRHASKLATRYVAGDSADAGLERASALLREHGIRSSLFYLGEYVESRELVALNVAHKLIIAEKLGAAGLDVHVSVDPTQIGFGVDPDLMRSNAFQIAQSIAEASSGRPGIHALMLDMEDARLNNPTIKLHDALSAAKLPVAITLQAYLRRTAEDLERLVRAGARVRLVKGAFAASSDIAFTRRTDVKAASRRLIDLMFGPEARRSGFYPVVATHDPDIQEYTIACAAAAGWPQNGYEFEMLLGVREELAVRLARRGNRVRLYVPFGRDWWPHAIRRIGENPANAAFLARSILSDG